MSLEQWVEVSFLAIACLSLCVQLWGLVHIAARPGDAPAAHGLIRTSVCRVGCSVLYVFVGSNALFCHKAVIVTTFLVFCATQATWQANAIADVRLRRELDR